MVKIEIDSTDQSNIDIAMILSSLSIRFGATPDGGWVSSEIFDHSGHEVGTMTIDGE